MNEEAVRFAQAHYEWRLMWFGLATYFTCRAWLAFGSNRAYYGIYAVITAIGAVCYTAAESPALVAITAVASLVGFAASTFDLQSRFYGAKRIEPPPSIVEATVENRMFEEVFEAFADGVLIASEQCEVVRINQRFCELTGYQEGDLIGHHVKKVFAGHDHHFDDFSGRHECERIEMVGGGGKTLTLVLGVNLTAPAMGKMYWVATLQEVTGSDDTRREDATQGN